MKMTQTLRLILGAAVLTAAVAVLWWIVGFALGRSALEQAGAGGRFASIYTYRDSSVIPLFAPSRYFSGVVPSSGSVVSGTSLNARVTGNTRESHSRIACTEDVA